MSDLVRSRPWLKSWPAIDVAVRVEPGPDRDLAGFLEAFLDDFSPTAIVELPVAMENTFGWRVFFGSPEARALAADALEASSHWSTRVRVGRVDVADEQWAERSQADLAAVVVERVIVAPPWDVARARRVASGATGVRRVDSGELVVVEIEPSMGFGTGHHESTRLCLRALQAIELTGRRLMDLGTGSGVLAIAAALLGCARAIAIDDDRDALDAAEDNVRRNGVQGRVELRLASLASRSAAGSDDRVDLADVVVGNLTGGLLRRHAAAVASFVAPGGTLVLGGFTLDERLAVLHAFERFTIVREHSETGWAALTLCQDRI